jgi:hypothetical protein
VRVHGGLDLVEGLGDDLVQVVLVDAVHAASPLDGGGRFRLTFHASATVEKPLRSAGSRRTRTGKSEAIDHREEKPLVGFNRGFR